MSCQEKKIIHAICTSCNGSGKKSEDRCISCNGSGNVSIKAIEGTFTEKCHHCRGTGTVVCYCQNCRGIGSYERVITEDRRNHEHDNNGICARCGHYDRVYDTNKDKDERERAQRKRDAESSRISRENEEIDRQRERDRECSWGPNK